MATKGKKPGKPTRKMTPTPPPKAASSKPKASKPSKVDASNGPSKATNNATKATPAYVEDLRPGPVPKLGDIPWGYGDTRIVGMARDPLWACVYWEVTDESIKAARKKLGDEHAGLALRIYDTTGRDFNGLNAHLHWDLGVDRGTTIYHFKAGKPGVTLHIDIGVSNGHGGFQPIARSNPVEMPRDSISSDTRTDVTTVFRTGTQYTYRHRYQAPPGGGGGPAGHGPGPGPGEPPHFAESEHMFKHLTGEGWSRSEWMETLIDGRTMRWIRWSGPVMAEHLPFLPKGASYQTIEMLFHGEKRIIKIEGGEKIVFGPWRVTLEAVGHQGERRTIEHWMVKQRWTTHQGMIRVETPAIITRILGGRRVTVVQAGSEARLQQEEWSSQVLQQGASEWRWIGASENMMQGSSETLMRGSSELFYLGSSERLYQGSSEMLYLGASETFELGASERYYGGSSEERP